jgi:hypothetical protein
MVDLGYFWSIVAVLAGSPLGLTILANVALVIVWAVLRPARPQRAIPPFEPYVEPGCVVHGPCCGLPEDDPRWDQTEYLRPSEWRRLYGPAATAS